MGKNYFFDKGESNSHSMAIKDKDSRNSVQGYLARGFEPGIRRNTNIYNNYK